MPTINNNKKILDSKQWEMMSPAPASNSSNTLGYVASSRHVKHQVMYLAASSAQHLYFPSENAWLQIGNQSISIGSGLGIAASGVSTGNNTAAATLTATGGTTTTIITNQTLARDLRGFSIHIVSGPNAGSTLEIRSNTIGANATITVDSQASAFTASTVFRLITPTWYVASSGSSNFRKYDFATNTWVTLANPSFGSSESRLIATPSWIDTNYVAFATGTATAGGASTLTNSSKNWTANQWANYQVRLVSGTGAGQIRTITSNTATVITVGTAWTIQPDSTTTYSIEGNDDFLYYFGSGVSTVQRYSISANTWTTLSPTTARGGSLSSNGSGANWVWEVNDADWSNENSIRNGSRIYSFRGGSSSTLDYYDIAANTWVNSITYAYNSETFTTGAKYATNGNFLYIHIASGRWGRYNFVTSELEPWSNMIYPQGSGVPGELTFDVVFRDGATSIVFIYMILNSSNIMLRQMVI